MRRVAVIAGCLLGFACGPDEGPSHVENVPAPHNFPPGDPGDGGDGGGDTGNPDFRISATPDELTVPQGGSAEISVTVVRTEGFAEPVRVTVDGMPAGISASELLLGPADTEGIITLTAPATIGVPANDPARVRGHASEGTRSDPIAIAVRGPASALDTSFGDGGILRAMLEIRDVDERSDGSLVFTGMDFSNKGGVCRVHANGKPDLSFGTARGCAFTPVDGTGASLVLLDGGAILLAISSNPELSVARFTVDGDLDTTFGEGGIVYAGPGGPISMVVTGGRIVLSGADTTGAFLMRLTADGTIDPAFGVGGRVTFGSGRPADFTRLTDGRFVATTGSTLYAFTADGAPDATFGGGDGMLELPVICNAVSRSAGSGAILAAGEGMAVVRISATGAIEAMYPALDPGEDESGTQLYANATDLWVQEDGTMILGGDVSTDDLTMGIGRRHRDGSADEEFGTGGAARYGQADTWGTDIHVLRDGRYVLAGTRTLDHGLLIRAWN